jgi:hypothetical protein
MGFNIYYEGIIKFDKPLDNETYNLITNLQTTRRMIWDVRALERDGLAKSEEIGWQGEFFFPERNMTRKECRELEKKYVLEANFAPGGQPDVYGVWLVTEDREGLIWNRKEKSYYGHEWLQYLVKKILVPRGYVPNGIINWFAEYQDTPRKFHTIVEGNKVVKKRGYHKSVKAPDIEGWFDEQLKEYDESHQNWITNLVENEVQFLHKNSYQGTLSFNLYVDKNIIQTVLKAGKIESCKYLYRNVRKENGEWLHDDIESIQVSKEGVTWSETPEDAIIRDNFLLKKCLDFIQRHQKENPDFLNESII